MPDVLIVADDLTGALDSSVPFVLAGLRCIVARQPKDLKRALATDAAVVAVNTGSRDGSAKAAQAAILSVVSCLDQSALPLIFKKIDSRLKGHAGLESQILARELGLCAALVCPAIPAQGRTVQEGYVCGTGVLIPISIAEVFSSSGLKLSIPDTKDDDALFRAFTERAQDELLIGAAGLATALARHLNPTPTPSKAPSLQAPVLFAIGSRDEITMAQVDALKAQYELPDVTAPNGKLSDPLPANTSVLARMTQGQQNESSLIAAQNFAQSLGEELRQKKFATVVSCGGETTNALLAQLNIGLIKLESELLPGVPVSTIQLPGQRLTLVTKSGGFGGPKTLASVFEAVEPTPKVGIR